MTIAQQIITIAMVVLGTMLTRFLPFFIFPGGRETPAFIQYLGKVLPAAVFGLLVIYSLKDVSLLSGSHGIPEAISILAVILLHLVETADAGFHRWRHRLLYAAGSACVLKIPTLLSKALPTAASEESLFTKPPIKLRYASTWGGILPPHPYMR